MRLMLVLMMTLFWLPPASLGGDTTPNFQSEHCKAMRDFYQRAEQIRSSVMNPLLGFDVDFHKVASGEKGNLVHSPFSVTAVLSMVLAGASGETERELQKALGLDKVPDQEWQEWHKMHGLATFALTCPREYKTTELNVANALFPQRGKPIKAPFLDLLKQAYDAAPDAVDYEKDTEGARRHINEWVARMTRGKIPELIAKGLLASTSKLTLVNAVYLKGAWAQKFPKANTKDGTFHAGSGDKKTKMMRVEGGSMHFRYAASKGVKSVAVELEDGETSFVVMLPDENSDLAALEASLTKESLDKTLEGLKGQRVNLTLPKFKLESELKLTDALKQLGIKQLFDPKNAALDKIDGGADQLFVSDVVQKAMIDVHEEGMEAAAATAAMMRAGSAMPKPTTPVEFVVDRPFLFLVHDRSTNAVLFMGRVEDPTKS